MCDDGSVKAVVLSLCDDGMQESTLLVQKLDPDHFLAALSSASGYTRLYSPLHLAPHPACLTRRLVPPLHQALICLPSDPIKERLKRNRRVAVDGRHDESCCARVDLFSLCCQ